MQLLWPDFVVSSDVDWQVVSKHSCAFTVAAGWLSVMSLSCTVVGFSLRLISHVRPTQLTPESNASSPLSRAIAFIWACPIHIEKSSNASRVAKLVRITREVGSVRRCRFARLERPTDQHFAHCFAETAADQEVLTAA